MLIGVIAAGPTLGQPARPLDRLAAKEARPMVERAAAEAGARAPEPLEQLIDELDSDVFETRERAYDALAARRDVTVEQIGQFLARPELSPEQHNRLRSLGVDALGNAPKGGLGVQFGIPTNMVRIDDVVDNGMFPAAKLIRPGDLIVEADGLPVRDQDHMKIIILSRRPGDVLRLGVLRAGERVVIDAELGAFSNLRTNEPRRQELEAAFEERLRMLDLASDGNAAVGAGLDAADWMIAALGDHAPETAPQPAISPPPPVIVGGAPDEHFADHSTVLRRTSSVKLQDDLEAAIFEIARIDRRIAVVERMLADDGIEPDDRPELMREVAALRRELNNANERRLRLISELERRP